MEEPVHDKELNFRSLFENAADAIFIAEESTGIIVDTNSRASQMMGIPVEKIIGLHQSKLHPPNSEEKSKINFLKHKKELDAQELAKPIINFLLSADGKNIPVEVLASRVRYHGKSCLMGTFRDISERVASEKAIRKNEANLKAIIENSLESIWSIDTEYNIQYINEVFAKEFQESFGVLLSIGSNILEALPPPLRSLWKERYDRAFNNEHFVFTDRIDYKGNTIYVEVAMNPIVLDNVVVGASFYGKNITEKKHAEDALRKSEERFRTLSTIATQGIMIHENGIILEANLAFAKILGYVNPEEIIGKNGLELLGLTPSSKEKVRKHLEDKSNETYEIELSNKNGDILHAETSGSEIFYMGKYARLVYMRDISERKHAEEAVKRIQRMQGKMVDNIGDVIIILDENGVTKHVSPNIRRLFGWKPDEVIGKSIWNSVHPENIEDAKRTFSLLIKKACETATFEFRYKCKDGNYKWIEFTGSNLLHDPDINGLLGNYREISERKNHERELIRAKEKAEESDHLKSAFLANMSHEIRTPMNGILGFADLLKAQDINSDQQQEYLEIISTSGKRMLNILNDLINISKIESGQMELNFSNTNLNQQLNYLFTFFRTETEHKGLNLNLHLPVSKQLTINTDEEKVYAILTNLIKNAIKFTDRGSIDFGYEIKSDMLEFYVKDTGIGIPDDKLSLVFDRFVQVDLSKSSGYEGAGLGLSITKAYVEMLGGNIWLKSKEGLGSEFYFTIPNRSAIIAEVSTSKKSDLKQKDLVINNSTILIAEDDVVSLKYLQRVLGKDNYKLLLARTGIEAVELCQKHKDIKLILMDIKMPEMDGHTAAIKIKEFLPDVPIIAQTAYALNSEREKFNAVFDDYLTKPLKSIEISLIIHKHLMK